MPKTEMDGKAIPKIPSNFPTMNEGPDNLVASPKSTSLTVTPETETISLETNPLIPPEP